MKKENRPLEVTVEAASFELKNNESAPLNQCHAYLAWFDQEIARIEKIQELNEREEEQIALLLKSARLLYGAGRIASARYAYEDALLQAYHSNISKIQETTEDIKNEMRLLPDMKGITLRPLYE